MAAGQIERPADPDLPELSLLLGPEAEDLLGGVLAELGARLVSSRIMQVRYVPGRSGTVPSRVEAAHRVIEDPTEEKMADAISHIVSQRIESRQLNEAPLTLAQLDRVKREFLRVVAGMYHSRIEYPEEAGGITADWDAAKDA